MPTALEQQGDFSKSLNIDGGVRTVFDPWTSLLNQDGSVSVTPFPGNVVPQSRFDPLAAKLIKEFWAPNNAGANITGLNNYSKGFIEKYGYYNFSERADYNINDKWKVFGRLGRYNTTDIQGNPTPNNSELYVPTGTARAAWNVGGDAIWSINARTVAEFRGDWHSLLDAYISRSAPFDRLGIDLAEQCLVRAVSNGFRRRAGLFPEYEHRGKRVRRRRVLLEPGAEGRSCFRQDRAAKRLALSQSRL